VRRVAALPRQRDPPLIVFFSAWAWAGAGRRSAAIASARLEYGQEALMVNRKRRKVLKSGGGATLLGMFASTALLKPGSARAQSWNKAAFEGHNLPETMKALGSGDPAPSKDIVFFQTPEIAENGAVVPVGITSNIPKTESIAILIEKNPNMLAAVFDLPGGTEPTVSTRVKMAQTSNIYALVKADGKYYVASKEVKVTLGGCGG
jgi:sulfur-oxidizing protein SoxY